jgi:hypothetical protein
VPRSVRSIIIVTYCLRGPDNCRIAVRAGPGPVSVLSRGPSYHITIYSTHTPQTSTPKGLHTRLPMSSRASGSSTALRRLMTEYKQLTSGGMSCGSARLAPLSLNPTIALALAQARRMACSQPGRSPNLTSSLGKPSSADPRTRPSKAVYSQPN